MTAEGPVNGWAAPVADWLAAALPRAPGEEGWQDLACTAYQFGCDALAALGHARRMPWGAAPLAVPQPPEVQPRWDDVCVAVLALADQRDEIDWRLPDGSRPPPRGAWRILHPSPPAPPAPNIAAAQGCGPAHAATAVAALLDTLGLTAEGRWMAAAEPVLWRDRPSAWQMAVADDPRFADGLAQALATLPADLGEALAALATVTDDDVARAREDHARQRAEIAQRHGPKAHVSPMPDAAGLRRGLLSARRNRMDWLFFTRWRLADGWLDAWGAARALGIFHDPLAIDMRRAVMARLHPDFPADA